MGAAGAQLPPMLPAESRAVLPAPPSLPLPAVNQVRWIPLAATPRLLLQSQRAGTRGGDWAIIGADGSDEPPGDGC